MPEKSLIVKKHSAFVQISVKNLTLIQRKMINSLMYLAQKEGNSDKKIYRTTIHSLKEMCKIDSTENVDLKAQLKKLSQITIEFNYLNKDKNEVWECMSLLASSKIIKNTNIIEFEFSWALLGKIINPSIYAPLNVRLISNLKSSYSIILYEFLRDYIDSPVMPLLMIEDFKELMGIKKHEYKFFPNFKKWVLDTAVKEINAKMDIQCTYKLIKKCGNKYSHIQFNAKRKKPAENFIHDIDIEAIPRATIIELSIIPEKEKNIILEKQKIEPADVNLEKENNIEESGYNSIIANFRTLLKEEATEAVLKMISEALKKYSPSYLLSQIQYSLIHSKTNFAGHLAKGIEKDYAAHERQKIGIKNKIAQGTAIEKAEKQKAKLEAAELEKQKEKEEEKKRRSALNWWGALSEEKKKEMFAKYKHKFSKGYDMHIVMTSYREEGPNHH